MCAFCDGDAFDDFVCSPLCGSELKVIAVCCRLQQWRMDAVKYGIQSASLSDLVLFHQKSAAQI